MTNINKQEEVGSTSQLPLKGAAAYYHNKYCENSAGGVGCSSVRDDEKKEENVSQDEEQDTGYFGNLVCRMRNDLGMPCADAQNKKK